MHWLINVSMIPFFHCFFALCVAYFPLSFFAVLFIFHTDFFVSAALDLKWYTKCMRISLFKVDKSNSSPFTLKKYHYLDFWSDTNVDHIGTWVSIFWISLFLHFYFNIICLCLGLSLQISHKYARAQMKRNWETEHFWPANYFWPEQISVSSEVLVRNFRMEWTISHITVTCDCVSWFGARRKRSTARREQNELSIKYIICM